MSNAAGLQIRATGLVADSWRFVTASPHAFLSCGALPLLLALGIALTVVLSLESGLPGRGVRITSELAYVVPWTLFGVAWHRVILLEGPAADEADAIWSWTHTRFALFLLVWLAPGLVLSEVIIAQGHEWLTMDRMLLLLVGSSITAYLYARLALFLPAAAVGECTDLAVAVGTAFFGSLSRLLFEGLAVGALSFAYRRVRVYEAVVDSPAR